MNKMSENDNEIQNPEEMIKKISKQLYNDEYFIEKAIYTEKAQQNKTFTFFRDDTKNDIQKYCWCQRPCDTNMSLHRFFKNGTIEAFMSESLAEEHGLIQIDLNEFIWKFVQPLIEENIKLRKDNEIQNHIYNKECAFCGKEFVTKLKRQIYCSKNCNLEAYWNKFSTEEKREKRNDTCKKYKKSHPEKIKEIQARYRKKHKNIES